MLTTVEGSADHSTLLAAVKAAGLESALAGPGPITLLAPVNSGFAKLPAGTLDTLLKPENKAVLAQVLKNHVIVGSVLSTDIAARIKEGGGKASLTTLAGQPVTAQLDGTAVTLTDGNGNVARVLQADATQSNGVIHVIDGLLLPKPAK